MHPELKKAYPELHIPHTFYIAQIWQLEALQGKSIQELFTKLNPYPHCEQTFSVEQEKQFVILQTIQPT